MFTQLYNGLKTIKQRLQLTRGIFSASLFSQLERGKGDGKRKQFSDLPLCFRSYHAETELKWGIFGEYLCDVFLSLPVSFFFLIVFFSSSFGRGCSKLY